MHWDERPRRHEWAFVTGGGLRDLMREAGISSEDPGEKVMCPPSLGHTARENEEDASVLTQAREARGERRAAAP